MAETKIQHQTTSRGLVWRSLGMLRAVRGLIVVLLWTSGNAFTTTSSRCPWTSSSGRALASSSSV